MAAHHMHPVHGIEAMDKAVARLEGDVTARGHTRHTLHVQPTLVLVRLAQAHNGGRKGGDIKVSLEATALRWQVAAD